MVHLRPETDEDDSSYRIQHHTHINIDSLSYAFPPPPTTHFFIYSFWSLSFFFQGLTSIIATWPHHHSDEFMPFPFDFSDISSITPHSFVTRTHPYGASFMVYAFFFFLRYQSITTTTNHYYRYTTTTTTTAATATYWPNKRLNVTLRATQHLTGQISPGSTNHISQRFIIMEETKESNSCVVIHLHTDNISSYIRLYCNGSSPNHHSAYLPLNALTQL